MSESPLQPRPAHVSPVPPPRARFESDESPLDASPLPAARDRAAHAPQTPAVPPHFTDTPRDPHAPLRTADELLADSDFMSTLYAEFFEGCSELRGLAFLGHTTISAISEVLTHPDVLERIERLSRLMDLRCRSRLRAARLGAINRLSIVASSEADDETARRAATTLLRASDPARLDPPDAPPQGPPGDQPPPPPPDQPPLAGPPPPPGPPRPSPPPAHPTPHLSSPRGVASPAPQLGRCRLPPRGARRPPAPPAPPSPARWPSPPTVAVRPRTAPRSPAPSAPRFPRRSMPVASPSKKPCSSSPPAHEKPPLRTQKAGRGFVRSFAMSRCPRLAPRAPPLAGGGWAVGWGRSRSGRRPYSGLPEPMS